MCTACAYAVYAEVNIVFRQTIVDFICSSEIHVPKQSLWWLQKLRMEQKITIFQENHKKFAISEKYV